MTLLPYPNKGRTLKFETFSVDFCQAVLWTSGFDVSSKSLTRLTSGPWSDVFDGDPTLLPSGQNLPVDVPKLSVSSADERWRLQIGASRAEIMWQNAGHSDPVVPSAFAETCTKAFREYLDVSDELVVTRLAFVTRRFSAIANPAREIAAYFARDEILAGPFNRPNEIQINAHKVYKPTDLPTLNSWVKWRNGFVKHSGESVVTIEQDLNTLAESITTFTRDEVAEFLLGAPKEADSILQYYLSFPVQPKRD